jgi:hypothetical protein
MYVRDADVDFQNHARREAERSLKHGYWKRFMWKESSPGTFARTAAGSPLLRENSMRSS